MMLVISTQVYENYGAHDWNGQGECPQYWKAKGGSEYKITDIPLNVDFEEIVTAANVEQHNSYIEESIVSWSIENDDYLSSFEKSQLEYEGEIVYKEPVIEYSDLAALHSIDQYEDQARVENLAAEAFL